MVSQGLVMVITVSQPFIFFRRRLKLLFFPGGGLFVENAGKWYLRGIISANLNADAKCDLKSFDVYTDVAKFTDWLEKFVETYG